MSDLTETQQEIIEATAAASSEWPLAFIAAAPNGLDMKVQPGLTTDGEQRTKTQVQFAAAYLMFVHEHLFDGDIYETAENVASIAEQMNDEMDYTSIHTPLDE